ncbi:MAG: hypothetical protein L6R42_001893 [Xanthoria sp. 1 TBL-2021]|nr:MAG: hypothetical protein L6R42_001893 [Xanthoria sp. 1 TBL-2021]
MTRERNADSDITLDHLYAIKKIDEVHAKGGKVCTWGRSLPHSGYIQSKLGKPKVKEFYSYCGGLPAQAHHKYRACHTAEHAQNPLGFKFSWSPRGCLLSQHNSAHFLSANKEITISRNDLMNVAKPYFVLDGYEFVAYPNRDSVPFREYYGIPEAETVIRGSLRYAGNPAFVKALIDLGWLDPEPKEWLKTDLTWAQVFQKAIGANDPCERYVYPPSAFEINHINTLTQIPEPSTLTSRVNEICHFPTKAENTRILSGLHWIGLFSSNPATIRGNNLLDTLCAQLEKYLSYQPCERDLVILQHKFEVEWQDGKKETSTSTLELYGDADGYSAMAKSVGVTCGIAAQLVLEGHEAFKGPGVMAPYRREICDPIRELLEKEGITLVEKIIED